MLKTILPRNVINTWDHFLVANAYLKKLRPHVGFVGGFNMMVMAGVFNNTSTADKKPEQELIDLLEETIPTIEMKLQSSILDFFSFDMRNIHTIYRMIPTHIADEPNLNRHISTEYRPSLVFLDEVLHKILKHFRRLESSGFIIVNEDRNKNEAALVFADRKSLIRFVKEKDITIEAFGRKWKP
jgi:hypothetical protein